MTSSLVQVSISRLALQLVSQFSLPLLVNDCANNIAL